MLNTMSPGRHLRRLTRSGSGLRASAVFAVMSLAVVAGLAAPASEARAAAVESASVQAPIEIDLTLESGLPVYDLLWADHADTARAALAEQAIERMNDASALYLLRLPQIPVAWRPIPLSFAPVASVPTGDRRRAVAVARVALRDMTGRAVDLTRARLGRIHYERDLEASLLDVVERIRAQRPGAVLSLDQFVQPETFGARAGSYRDLIDSLDFVVLRMPAASADAPERVRGLSSRSRARISAAINRGPDLDRAFRMASAPAGLFALIEVGGEWVAVDDDALPDAVLAVADGEETPWPDTDQNADSDSTTTPPVLFAPPAPEREPGDPTTLDDGPPIVIEPDEPTPDDAPTDDAPPVDQTPGSDDQTPGAPDDAPPDEPPADDAPTDMPTDETPTDAPSDDAPTDEPPADDGPGDDVPPPPPPSDDAPGDDTPSDAPPPPAPPTDDTGDDTTTTNDDGGVDLPPPPPPTDDDTPDDPPADQPGDTQPDAGPDTPGPAPVLIPGGGFAGPTPTPAPIGSGAGADAKAIARWDVVPYQTITGQFQIGVVAFHINGIDRVEFSADGGPWARVYDMTLNPRTGVWEYVATLDAENFDDGPVEVRAVAYPTVGVPRVLQGPIDGSSQFRNGNHALFLNANHGGSLPIHTAWVDAVAGDDVAGEAGDPNQPFKSPMAALARISWQFGSADGAVVYLRPGEYGWGAPTAPQKIKTDARWATITTANGVNPRDVTFTWGGPGGFGTRLIRAQNVTFRGNNILTNGTTDKHLWVDNCVMIGAGLDVDGGFFSAAWWGGMWFTDDFVTLNRNGIRAATFVRDCRIERISGSPFGSARVVINSTVRTWDPGSTDFHGDVFHWFPATDDTENYLVYGVDVEEFPSQGVFAEVMGGSRMDNVAFVNVNIAKGTDDPAGSWWEVSTNHLLMWYVSIPDQWFRWVQSNYNTALENVSIVGSVFQGFQADVLPTTFDIEHNHFILPTSSGYGIGDDMTRGDPGYVNAASGDRRPSAGSPLRARLPLADRLPRWDLRGRRRASMTAVGPFIAVDESP